MARKVTALHAHREGAGAAASIPQVHAGLFEAGLHCAAECLDLRARSVEDDVALHIGNAADRPERFEHQPLDGIEPIKQALAESCGNLGALHLPKVIDRAHVDFMQHGHEFTVDP